jgi:hypothetical protein
VVAGALIGGTAAIALWSRGEPKPLNVETGSGSAPAAEPRTRPPVHLIDGGDAHSPEPLTSRTLADHAQAARRTAAGNLSTVARDAGSSPCDSLLGPWRLGVEELTLQRAGLGSWHPGAGQPELPVRWLCMQDGTAEVQLGEGTWRLVVEADGSALVATDSSGARKSGRRGAPIQ